MLKNNRNRLIFKKLVVPVVGSGLTEHIGYQFNIFKR
jgi:hypothetical protein